MLEILDNIKNYLKSLQYRRYFLPLLGLTGILFYEENYNNYYILGLITFMDSIIILGNFTQIVIWTNAKPVYLEDLYVDSTKLPLLPLDSKRKKIHKKIYTRILVFSNSSLMSVLICYWKLKLNNNTSFLEILALTGGLIEIAACFNVLTGRITLYIIKEYLSIQILAEENYDDVSNELDEVISKEDECDQYVLYSKNNQQQQDL